MVVERRQLEIFECRTDDGGVGLRFGKGGPLFLGYDEADLLSLLRAVFPDADDGEPLDGDLLAIAELYLDPESAKARRQYLRDPGAYDVDEISLAAAEAEQEFREAVLYDGVTSEAEISGE